jgi:hypothetical protein
MHAAFFYEKVEIIFNFFQSLAYAWNKGKMDISLSSHTTMQHYISNKDVFLTWKWELRDYIDPIEVWGRIWRFVKKLRMSLAISPICNVTSFCNTQIYLSSMMVCERHWQSYLDRRRGCTKSLAWSLEWPIIGSSWFEKETHQKYKEIVWISWHILLQWKFKLREKHVELG